MTTFLGAEPLLAPQGAPLTIREIPSLAHVLLCERRPRGAEVLDKEGCKLNRVLLNMKYA